MNGSIKIKFLLFSLPNLVLFTSLFITSTFAWFTDFAINSGNRVQSGNLAVEFTASNTFNDNDLDGDLINLKNSTSPLFKFINPIQPGEQESYFIRIKSTGNISIKYEVDFGINETSVLDEVIMFDILRVYPNESDVETFSGKLIDQIKLNNQLESGLSINMYEIWSITLRYDESTTNAHNNSSLTFGIDIRLNAWQANFNAPQPAMVKTIEELAYEISQGSENILLLESITANNTDLVINHLLTIHLNGNSLSLNNLLIESNQFGVLEISHGELNLKSLNVVCPNAMLSFVNLVINALESDIESR